MLKKVVIIGLALLMGGIILGCAELDRAIEQITFYHFPNTDGNSWEYESSSSTTSETTIYKTTFNGTYTLGSLTLQRQKQESFSSLFSYTQEALVKVSDSDVKFYGTVSNPTLEAEAFLMFLMGIGDKWFTQGTDEATVMVKENVTVPAGTYNDCLKIRYTSGLDFRYAWLART